MWMESLCCTSSTRIWTKGPRAPPLFSGWKHSRRVLHCDSLGSSPSFYYSNYTLTLPCKFLMPGDIKYDLHEDRNPQQCISYISLRCFSRYKHLLRHISFLFRPKYLTKSRVQEYFPVSLAESHICKGTCSNSRWNYIFRRPRCHVTSRLKDFRLPQMFSLTTIRELTDLKNPIHVPSTFQVTVSGATGGRKPKSSIHLQIHLTFSKRPWEGFTYFPIKLSLNYTFKHK